MISRKKTRQVLVGNVRLGGDAPVVIQSMTNVPIEDVQATIRQVNQLQEAGADLVRLAVRTVGFIEYLKKIIPNCTIPLSADVHFDYRIAIEAIKAGVAKVRINPGNIGNEKRVKEVISVAKDFNVPIRIGVNSGSLDRKKYSTITADYMVQSALEQIVILEDNDFNDIIVSLKSSDINLTIEANSQFSKVRDYPLHVGLTEAGYGDSCIVQSSIAIGHLLLNGIGDTIRVSMTGDPVNEIAIAEKILESVGERKPFIRIIACPTCGRTDPFLDLLETAKQVEKLVVEKYRDSLQKKGQALEIAVMGCEVNGPGEAAYADLGLAGAGNGKMILFARGEKLRLVEYAQAVDELIVEIDNYLNNSPNSSK